MNYKSMLQHPLVKGTLLLSFSGVLSRCIGFFYKIFLSRTIGAEGIGIYQQVFPLYGLCIAFSCAGIQTAISHFVATEHKKGKEGDTYLLIGLAFSLGSNILQIVLLNQFASWLATCYLGNPSCESLIRIMSYALVPCSVHACLNGYYYGMKKAFLPSLSQLLEQGSRVLGIWLLAQILLSKGESLSPAHATWGILIGEIASSLCLLTGWCLRTTNTTATPDTICDKVRPFFAYALPLMAQHVLLTLGTSMENALLPQMLIRFGFSTSQALSLFGVISGMVLPFVFLPSIVTGSLSVLLLPSVSELAAAKEHTRLHKIFWRMICLGLSIGFAFSILYSLIGRWLGMLFFQDTLAGHYLQVLGWLCPFMAVTMLATSFYHGLGHPLLTLIMQLTQILLRIGVVLFFVPQYGASAYCIGLLLIQIALSLTLLLLFPLISP